MDNVENGVDPLDPRIQIELENLNNATDDINKLETELNEAHTAFRQLLSDTTRRLKEISDKLGTSCIEKARCYYEALEMARQAQVQCQQQAQLFQRASEIHAAAKETVALAEARFMSHQHEWNFDQAWQDMLNHATMKVMDAENQKAECGREHYRRAMLFHEAEKKLLQLEEKHRRAIIKARPYFDVKAQCDQMLATQKERVEYLQQTVKDVKRNYATSLRTLESISNQIHQQRRDYDIVANGPREPGVGAELIGSDTYQKYENEFSNCKISPIRYNQREINEKSHDIKKFCSTKENPEHIDKRSVDGSESNFTQWELELQASMEKLNRLSFGNSSSLIRKRDAQSSSDLRDTVDVGVVNNIMSAEIWHSLNQFPSSTKDLGKNLEKNEPVNGRPTSHLQRSYSMISSMMLTLQDASKTLAATSRSLNGSPVNRSKSNFDSRSVAEKAESVDTLKYVPNNMCQLDIRSRKAQSSWNINDYSNFDGDDDEGRSKCNDTNDNTSRDEQLTNLSFKFLPKEPTLSKGHCSPNSETSSVSFPGVSQHLANSQNNIARSSYNILQKITSRSANSSPMKLRNPSIPSVRSSDSENAERFDERSVPKSSQFAERDPSVKELPLLSFFGSAFALSTNRGKSCSMIDLDDKRNLKTLLDNSRLGNIQTISVERLANVRRKLVNNCLEIKTDDIEK